jgi:hypothetical protein
MNENMALIKSKLIETASHFLERMGMFYPFGLALLSNGDFIFYGVEEQDTIELPNSDILTERISSNLIQSIDDYSAQTIGMALNTVFSKDENPKVDCIEIRILDSSYGEFHTYVRYDIIENKLLLYAETSQPWL